jgi:hypothetical protein
MTLYSLVLFVHVAAALALFTALSFEVLSLVRLRRASTLTEVQLWMEPGPKAKRPAATSRRSLWSPTTASAGFSSGGCAKCSFLAIPGVEEIQY